MVVHDHPHRPVHRDAVLASDDRAAIDDVVALQHPEGDVDTLPVAGAEHVDGAMADRDGRMPDVNAVFRRT